MTFTLFLKTIWWVNNFVTDRSDEVVWKLEKKSLIYNQIALEMYSGSWLQGSTNDRYLESETPAEYSNLFVDDVP